MFVELLSICDVWSKIFFLGSMEMVFECFIGICMEWIFVIVVVIGLIVFVV